MLNIVRQEPGLASPATISQGDGMHVLKRTLLASSLVLIGCFSEPTVIEEPQGTTMTINGTSDSNSRTSTTTVTTAADSSATLSDDSTTTSLETSSSTADELCPTPLECRPFPQGWTPVVRATQMGCPMSTATQGFYREAPTANCACDCMPDPTEVQTCALLGSINVPNCSETQPLIPGCNVGTTGEDPNFYRMTFFEPTCQSTVVGRSLPSPAYEVCTPRGPMSDCGQNSWCAPSGEVCVARSGVHTCPPSYADRVPLAVDWEDRVCECSSCDYTCPETVTLHTDTECNADGIEVPADGRCTSLPARDIAYSATYDETATCIAGTPTAAPPEPIQPYTLCCDGD